MGPPAHCRPDLLTSLLRACSNFYDTDVVANLFTADPRTLRPQSADVYLRAARTLGRLKPTHLKMLHALLVGERTVQRAAVWAGVPQPDAGAALQSLVDEGLVERRERAAEVEFAPRDGHVVVLLYVALAHGRHGAGGEGPQPLLLRDGHVLAGSRRMLK